MFLRRTKRPLSIQLRELLWPSMGWQRTFLYMRHRLVRLPDTTHQIALGLAIGAGVSFTPAPGSHLVQSVFFAWIARANIFAALLGQLVGNPWTIIPMWILSYKVGRYIFDVIGVKTDASTHDIPQHVTLQAFWDELVQNPMESLVPWLVGGYVVGLLSIPLFYAGFYYFVTQARNAQVNWKKYRISKEAHSITDKVSS